MGPNGQGGAGPPPGNPQGTVLDFGRHIGWSIGEISRVDPGYLEWLDKQPQGSRAATTRSTGRSGHAGRGWTANRSRAVERRADWGVRTLTTVPASGRGRPRGRLGILAGP